MGNQEVEGARGSVNDGHDRASRQPLEGKDCAVSHTRKKETRAMFADRGRGASLNG